MADQERVSDVWADQPGRWRRLDLGTALLFALVGVPLHLNIGWGAAATALALAGALATRHRSWVVMSLLGLAAGLIQLVSGQTAYLADLAYAPIFFTLGRHRERGVRNAGLAAAGVGSVLGALNVVFGTDRAPTTASGLAVSLLGSAALAAVVCVGGWMAGYIRWQNQQALQARIDARVEAVERRRIAELYELEQARRRIATDMHDVVAHSWAVVAAQADGARYALPRDPERTDQSLGIIADTARSAIGDLRVLVAQLRDPVLATDGSGGDPVYGLPSAGPEQQVDLFARMRASGMTLEVREEGAAGASPLLSLTGHRLLAESLTNALKHGDLTEPVVVEQDWRDGYRLRVSNAVGERDSAGTGHGILGMVERAALAGGVASSRADGARWIVDVVIPAAQS